MSGWTLAVFICATESPTDERVRSCGEISQTLARVQGVVESRTRCEACERNGTLRL